MKAVPMLKCYDQIAAFPREYGVWGPTYTENMTYGADRANGKLDR